MKLETIIFSPIGQGLDWVSVGFGGIAILGCFVLFYQFLNKRKARSSEVSSGPIIALVALATLLASAAFIYSVETNDQLENVEITTQFIRTPFGSCNLNEVKSVYFYPEIDKSSATVDKQQETYLIIEQSNGHRHPLSSKSYDIEEIYDGWKKLSKR